VSLDDMPDIADTIADGAAIEDEALLAALPGQLAALPMAAQVALRMHYLQALTQQEIAEALEIPLGTVKSRLAYGLMWLRRSWTPPRNG
jgi:RNA polymerase sigma-70 factor (ECF subfamily)